jgi:hypothetical protein
MVGTKIRNNQRYNQIPIAQSGKKSTFSIAAAKWKLLSSKSNDVWSEIMYILGIA